MIILKNFGSDGCGLGNQLFQLAAGTALAVKLNTDCMYPKWKYGNFISGPFNDSLQMEMDMVYRGVLHHQYFESIFYHVPIPDNKNQLLYGYFQSEKYFENCKGQIEKMFTPKPEFMKLLQDIDFSRFLRNNITAIHVRRGDYLTKSDYHYNLTMFYYLKAMAELSVKCGDDITFLIFSDDIDWCKKSFPKSDRFLFSEGNSDIIDLYLMAFCKHHIIANSSFSWWGAYLARLFNPLFNYRNDERIVLAPLQWWGPAIRDKENYSTRDLFPDGWQKIEC